MHNLCLIRPSTSGEGGRVMEPLAPSPAHFATRRKPSKDARLTGVHVVRSLPRMNTVVRLVLGLKTRFNRFIQISPKDGSEPTESLPPSEPLDSLESRRRGTESLDSPASGGMGASGNPVVSARLRKLVCAAVMCVSLSAISDSSCSTTNRNRILV